MRSGRYPPAIYRPRRPQASRDHARPGASAVVARLRAAAPRRADVSPLHRLRPARARLLSGRVSLLSLRDARPWVCKTRGLCSSCDGRRMTQTAAHLVTHVLAPEPVYRQWTLSFPHRLRFRLLRAARLASAVLTAFVRVAFAYHRPRGSLGEVVCYIASRWTAHSWIDDGSFAAPGSRSVEAWSRRARYRPHLGRHQQRRYVRARSMRAGSRCTTSSI